MPASDLHRRCTGLAGVAYVVLAGLENMDFLTAPGRDGAKVLAYYTANPSGLRLATAAGALALLSYALFAVGTWSCLPRRRSPWALLLLTAGITGPAVAAGSLLARLAATAPDAAAATVTRLHTLHLDLRLAGGTFLGLTLLGVAFAAGVRLPRWLTICTATAGASLVPLSTAALVAPGPLPDALAFAAFIADAACIGFLAVWLLLPRAGFAASLAWIIFFVVTVAAGVSGLALLAFPDSTRTFFSWPLGPPPLAATIGACYLVAAAVYGSALRSPGHWPESRGLLLGIAALSVPIFAVTLLHLAAFDFTTWQSWAWVVLFAVFPLAAATALLRGPRAPGPLMLRGWPPIAYALVLAVAAAVLLTTPTVATRLPVAGGPFGARVLAGWFTLAAFLALRFATRPADETRSAALSLPLFPIAWLLAPLTTGLPTPDPTGLTIWYGTAITLLALALRPFVIARNLRLPQPRSGHARCGAGGAEPLGQQLHLRVRAGQALAGQLLERLLGLGQPGAAVPEHLHQPNPEWTRVDGVDP